jgi:hypothetical protein
MVVDVAPGVLAARAGAWVCTFLIEARLVPRTFRTDNAFRSACGRRTYVRRQTRAHSLAVYLSALTVGAAGRRVARINRIGLNG